MTSKPSRRTILKTAGIALGMPAAYPTSTSAAPALRERFDPSTSSPLDVAQGDPELVEGSGSPRAASRGEGKGTPKICLDAGLAGGGSNDEAPAAARRIRQLGVEYVIFGGGPIPWEESRLKDMMDRLKTNGLTLANLMIAGFSNAIYNRPGKDADIEKVIQSVSSARNIGLPVVECNWFAHRTMDG